MKKFIITCILALLTVFACISFSACGDKEGPAKSITFSETSVTLESKGTKQLTYTVKPANASVEISVSKAEVVKYEDGTLTALTAGTAVVKVYSPEDESVCAECQVTVNAPEGYEIRTSANCKFVYPSSWEAFTAYGTVAAYMNSGGSANVTLTSESRNNNYFYFDSDYFQNAIERTYEALGLPVTFSNCSVSQSEYLGHNRVHVVYEYAIEGLSEIYQEQMILSSEDKTYALTVTYTGINVDKAQIETIFSEFVGTD